MFTGIVQATAHIKIIEKTSTDITLEVDLAKLNTDLKIGDSIALDGVCLTIVSLDGTKAQFNLVNETLERTGFAQLEDGYKVNIEPSLTLKSKLDGHLVYGDVDSTGTIKSIVPEGKSKIYTFEYPKQYAKYMIDKGRITIDGASLTVINSSVDGIFSVALIPHSQDELNLTLKNEGDLVNLEFDVYAKIVFKQRGYNE